MRKVIILPPLLLGGLIAMASAITTVILPFGTRDGNDDGSLRAISNSFFTGSPDVLSCDTDLDGNVACTASTNGGFTNTTSGGGGNSFDSTGLHTLANTSMTAGIPGDQTSLLE